jgi:hypothetical protein
VSYFKTKPLLILRYAEPFRGVIDAVLLKNAVLILLVWRFLHVLRVLRQQLVGCCYNVADFWEGVVSVTHYTVMLGLVAGPIAVGASCDK